jgi:hypothetical protein
MFYKDKPRDRQPGDTVSLYISIPRRSKELLEELASECGLGVREATSMILRVGIADFESQLRGDRL